MATRALPQPTPLETIVAAVRLMSKPDLEALAEVLCESVIDRLDELDGDPDFEPEPDEPEDDSEAVSCDGLTVNRIGCHP